jgi:hypothetical protein
MSKIYELRNFRPGLGDGFRMAAARMAAESPDRSKVEGGLQISKVIS